MKKIILILTGLVFLTFTLFGVISCGPIRDCGRKFQYSGRIIFPDSIDKHQLKICFNDYEDFYWKNSSSKELYSQISDTAVMNNTGNYKYDGFYLCGCSENGKIYFERNDSLKYNIIYRDSIIQKGGFNINKLKVEFLDTITIVNIPYIKID